MEVSCIRYVFVGAFIRGRRRIVSQQDLDKDYTRRVYLRCVCGLYVSYILGLESPFLPHLLPNAQLLLWIINLLRVTFILGVLVGLWVLPNADTRPPDLVLPHYLGLTFCETQVFHETFKRTLALIIMIINNFNQSYKNNSFCLPLYLVVSSKVFSSSNTYSKICSLRWLIKCSAWSD